MKGFFFICLYINKICKYVSFAKKRMRKEGMNQREIRRCKIHRRMNVLRNRYDRRILGSMTVLIAGLTVCMGILLQMAHVSGIPTVNDGYGSVLLRNGADVYVIIGIIAFVAGVIFTVICIRFRDRKAHKQQE